MSGVIRGGYDYFPEEGGPGAVVFIHAPQDGVRRCVILSRRAYGCDTHWLGGLRKPCLVEHCRGCAAGGSREWRFWLEVIDRATGERGLLELGSRQRVWLDLAVRAGSLRGVVVELRRKGGVPGGAIEVVTVEVVGADALPEAVDVEGCMRRLWGLG